MKELLKNLSELDAPTGDEAQVASFLENEFKENGFEVKRDLIGNVIARKGKGRKVMIAAHMDEVALAITSITKDGLLHFAKVGGIYDAVLANTRVKVHADNGTIPGVVGIKPPHMMKEEELKKVIEHEHLLIDIGAQSKEEAEKLGVKTGTLVNYDSKFSEAAGERVIGKALDNRAGCAILAQIAREIGEPNCELILVGTVREETGLFGAMTSTYGIEPDFAIAVDTTIASGGPEVPEDKVPIKMNGGPAVTIMEGSGRGYIASKKLIDWIEEVAKEHKISIQREVVEGGATDASRMQYSKIGVLTASIGVPTRYLHSPSELLDMRDLVAAKDLVKYLANEFKNYK